MPIERYIEGFLGLSFGFYLYWPFLVSIFLLWKNRLLIEKKFTFMAISILLNYSILFPLAIAMTAFLWTGPSAFLQLGLLLKIIVCIVAIGVYILILSFHIFVTKQLVNKYS